jgi:methylmalonyl-CoA mutase, N-terminal domain
MPQQAISDAAWTHQREVESGERPVVGVNRFVAAAPSAIEIHRHLDAVEAREIAALERLRGDRDGHAVRRALDDVGDTARAGSNLVPALVEAVKVYATIGEICGELRAVFGEYRAPQIY